MMFFIKLLAYPAYLIYRLWTGTLRYRVDGLERVKSLVEVSNKPVIFAFWHGGMFPLYRLKARFSAAVLALVSPSRDGHYLASVLRVAGIQPLHGSSSRGGTRVLLQVVRHVRREERAPIICFAVDGPRGPRQKAKRGALFLAYALDASVVPVRISMQRKKQLTKSWDRFQFPLPFSRVHIVFDEPYSLDSGKFTHEVAEREQEKLQEKLEEQEVKAAPDMPSGSEKAKGLRNIGAALEGILLAVVRAIFSRLSPGGLRLAGKIIGSILWQLLPGRRALTIKNIEQHLGLAPSEARQLARKAFSQNAQSFLEVFRVSSFTSQGKDSPVVFESPGFMEFMQQHNGPIVVATAHLGAWELLAGLLGDIQKPSMVVVRRIKNPTIAADLTKMRGSRGAQIVYHRDAAPKVLRCLRKNGVVGFLVDHNTQTSEATFLPFLGQPAAVNIGPALLAVRSKALVLPAFLLRCGDGYFLRSLPPLDTASLEGDWQNRVHATVRFYTEAVEELVRQYPDQWFWLHNRWKTQPQKEI